MQDRNGERPSLRLDGYVRVSKVAGREGETFISPKVQEERIRAWATASGHEIVAMHHELDVSGGKMDRPKLNEVVRRIENHETDGVVVFRLDRFGRTLVGAVQLIEHIKEQGAIVASVSDGFDMTTDTGQLVLEILLSIAQFELRRIRASWRTARAEALGRGWHLGKPPYGYTRGLRVDPKTGQAKPYGPLVPEPEQAPFVAEAFKRRAGGASWTAIRDWLNESGSRTRDGHPWACGTIRRIVGSQTYLGVASGGHGGDPAVPGAHEPLIDEMTWHAAQRRVGRGGVGDSSLVARGLVRCASCRYTMGHQRAPDGSLRYRCLRQWNGGDCPAPSLIIASVASGKLGLDDYITEEMFNRERLRRIGFRAVDVRLEELQQELEAAESKLATAAEDVELEEALGRAAYLKRVAALQADMKAKRARYDEALREFGGALDMPIAEFEAKWRSGEMTLEDRRRALGRLVAQVFVRPRENGRAAPHRHSDDESRREDFAARVHIVWATDPAVDVPRQGRRDFVIRPFVFPDSDPDHAGVAVA